MGLLTALGLKLPSSAASSAPGPGVIDANVVSGGAGAMPAAPADKRLDAYVAARAPLQKIVDALNAHPQKAKIAASIAAASTKLGAADTSAASKDYLGAVKLLAEVKALCAAARKLADDWATYARRKADATALAMSFGSADYDWTAWANPAIAAADALANATPPNFSGAANALTVSINKVGEPIVKQRIAVAKAKLALIAKSSKAAQAFVKNQIDEGKRYLASAEAAMTAREWSVSLQTSAAALRMLGPAVRTCESRVEYDAQRVVTMAEIAKVRTAPLLKASADALDGQLVAADALATGDPLKIGAAVVSLRSTTAQAKAWAGLAPTLAAHATERAAADKELLALDQHVAAGKLVSQRAAVRKILADAKVIAAGADASADPATAWRTALTEVTRARADLAGLAKLADSLGVASAAEGAAANPTDVKALRTALEKLQADGKAAANATNTTATAAEFKAFDVQVKAAVAALAVPDGAAAARALAAAAAALIEAKQIGAGHAQFARLLGIVETQLTTLKKSPRVAAIKARIDPIDVALADAKARDQVHASTDALAALRRASDGVALARAADAGREHHDARSAQIGKRIDKVVDPTAKAALVTMAADAKKEADALAFDAAAKALDDIEVRLDQSQAEVLMKAHTVDSGALAGLSARMVGKGGAATVDKMIHDIPNGSDPAAMGALAQGRYGVKFKFGKPLPMVAATGTTPMIPAGDPVKAMRVVCDMFATIPQDIIKSKSLKGVEYSDAIGKNGRLTAGGSFSYDDAKVRMLGRPGIDQRFGAAQQTFDPKTGTSVAQLPATVDANCLPNDPTPVEYMGFAAAHEVGHSVDDATGFMAGKEGQAKYGGWTTYGASVQPIADAIGSDARFAASCKTAEQKQYVLDKLLNKPATPPAAALHSPEDVARKAIDNWHSVATAANVYRRQGDCTTLRIGDYVYHEAYARVWVRYLFSARNQGLTGYQFRAPGEWFAELYAGFRSKKLKEDHPAMEWLKKL